MLALALDGRANERRELLLPNEGLPEALLGENEAIDPLDFLGPAKDRRLEASAVLTDVALIVGMISVGVMIAGPLAELFLFGLKVGRDRELPKGHKRQCEKSLAVGDEAYGGGFIAC